MKKKFKLNIQLFAEDNIIKTTDIEPAISIDHVNRISSNINELRDVLGITELEPMNAGTIIKIYQMAQENTPAQVGEGETINLTKITRKLVDTIELKLNKYRKSTTAEAIQKSGRQISINKTDEKLISGIQKEIKTKFYDALKKGTGSATGTTLQNTMSAVWGALKKKFEDEDATPVYFISVDDAADYLGNAQITTQSAFGMTYFENFLGLGTTFIVPSIEKGKVYGTAKENLNGAYVPAGSGDVAESFGLMADEIGMVGMTHVIKSDNATIETLAFSGVVFYPEFADKIIVGTIDDGKLDALTVKSAAGSSSGKTKITVTPELESGHTYKYKSADSTAPTVENLQNVRNWASWDGKSELTIATGQKLTVVECDSNYRAIKSGEATVTANGG